jgi:N-formylglutamate deformylase
LQVGKAAQELQRVTDESEPQWLTVRRGSAPLVVTMPHTGTELVGGIEAGLESPWLARKDADWWIHRLYDFAGDLGATVIRTAISRTVIDANRDPSGASLYPGQATTGPATLRRRRRSPRGDVFTSSRITAP